MFMSSYLWVQKKLPGWFVAECPLLDTRMMLKGVSAVCFSYFPLYFFYLLDDE